jgi:hypothetical protein
LEIRQVVFCVAEEGGSPMSESGVRGIDLFKIAGASISGWIPSWKTGDIRPTRQPFCSQMEEQLLLHLEYHPRVAWYGRGDMSATFASIYKITSPLPIPFTINYLFESKAHVYLPDAIGQLLDGRLFIAEAGLKPRQTPGAESSQGRSGAQSRRATGRGLLDCNGDHPVQNAACQFGLFACSAPKLSRLVTA